jgi:parvulin-like peptidyl-prolyl isomerase
MKTGDMVKEPVKINENWVVFGVRKREEADLAKFASERDQLKQSMMNQRQSQVFEDYVSGVEERMKRDGKIKIYEDVLEALPEDEEPGLPAGLNFPPG